MLISSWNIGIFPRPLEDKAEDNPTLDKYQDQGPGIPISRRHLRLAFTPGFSEKALNTKKEGPKVRSIFITCEHASNQIPKSHAVLFADAKEILQSHRGWDYGAKPIATYLAQQFKAPVLHGQFSRLLIDLNRSKNNSGLFSAWTKTLDLSEKSFLLKNYHAAHWDRVHGELKKLMKKNMPVLHIGVHSFTPVFKNKTRKTDIGILYDPTRPYEHKLAMVWQKELKATSDLVIHRNRPYRGVGDGLVTALRKDFSNKKYGGIEVEVNHRLMKNAKDIQGIAKLLKMTLEQALKNIAT